MADAAMDGFETALRGWLGSVGRQKWTSSLIQRRALADHLRTFPLEPFDGEPATEAYWNTLVSRVVDVATALTGPNIDAPTQRLIAVLWASAQLALVAMRRAVRADASLRVIGQPPRQAQASFSGGVSAQPPALVRDHIRASLPTPPGGNLRLEHLVEFLCADAALDFLRQHNPGVDTFLSSLTGPLGARANDVARQLLRNIGSVVADNSGQLDARLTFAAMTNGLRQLALQEIRGQLAPILRERMLARPDLKTYFDEVFMPSVEFTLNTVFAMVENWPQHGSDRDRLKEALSGVLMKLVGRSVVVTADIMVAAAQSQMNVIMNDLADHVDAPNGIVAVLSQEPNLPVAASEIAELVADALRIGAETLGPLSDVQRSRIRSLMYRAIDPLPLDADQAFLQLLAQDAFIPNSEDMLALSQELMAISAERFLIFVQKLLELIGRKFLEELGQVLEAAGRAVAQWLDEAQATLREIGQQIQDLIAEIDRLIDEVAAAFDEAVDDLLGALSHLATRSGRRKFRTKTADVLIGELLGSLEDNFVYRELVPGGVKANVRVMARDALELALDNAIVDQVLDVIGEVAEEIDSFVDDIRELDPDRDLAEQVGDLLLTRLTDALYDAFGDDPRIDIEFDVVIAGFRHRIDLGKIDVPVEAMVDGLRNAIRVLDVVEDSIRAAAGSLAVAFAKEEHLRSKEQERDELEITEARLKSQTRAFENVPRSVRILSPVVGAVVTGPVVLRIEIQGLTRQAVGEEADRPSAIHVYVNQRPLPLSRFTIAETAGTGVKKSEASPLRRELFSVLSASPLRPHPTAAPRPQVSRASVSIGVRPLSALEAAGRTRPVGRLALTTKGAAILQQRLGGAKPGGTTATRARPATAAGRLGRADRRLGAARPVSKLGRIAESSPSGIVLSCQLALEDVDEGVNVVSASITPPRGSRIETSVTFLAEAPPKVAPPKPGVIRLPGRPKPVAGSGPKKIPGKFLLAPKKERLSGIRTARTLVESKAAATRITMIAKLPAKVQAKFEQKPLPRRPLSQPEK
jgi:hypothetical protein